MILFCFYFCEFRPLLFDTAKLIEADGALVGAGGVGAGGAWSPKDLSTSNNPANTNTTQTPINVFIDLLLGF